MYPVRHNGSLGIQKGRNVEGKVGRKGLRDTSEDCCEFLKADGARDSRGRKEKSKSDVVAQNHAISAHDDRSLNHLALLPRLAHLHLVGDS
jgi:hypothetical protein